MITVSLSDEQAEALVAYLDDHELLPDVIDVLLQAIPYTPEPTEVGSEDWDELRRQLDGQRSTTVGISSQSDPSHTHGGAYSSHSQGLAYDYFSSDGYAKELHDIKLWTDAEFAARRNRDALQTSYYTQMLIENKVSMKDIISKINF